MDGRYYHNVVRFDSRFPPLISAINLMPPRTVNPSQITNMYKSTMFRLILVTVSRIEISRDNNNRKQCEDFANICRNSFQNFSFQTEN